MSNVRGCGHSLSAPAFPSGSFGAFCRDAPRSARLWSVSRPPSVWSSTSDRHARQMRPAPAEATKAAPSASVPPPARKPHPRGRRSCSATCAPAFERTWLRCCAISRAPRPIPFVRTGRPLNHRAVASENPPPFSLTDVGADIVSTGPPLAWGRDQRRRPLRRTEAPAPPASSAPSGATARLIFASRSSGRRARRPSCSTYSWSTSLRPIRRCRCER